MMLGLAERHRYTYLLSIDDDVWLPPWVLADLLKVGPEADAEGCGVTAPLLNNGVPGTELFADTWLEPQQRAGLYDCFSNSSVEFCDLFLSANCDGPNAHRFKKVDWLEAPFP